MIKLLWLHLISVLGIYFYLSFIHLQNAEFDTIEYLKEQAVEDSSGLSNISYCDGLVGTWKLFGISSENEKYKLVNRADVKKINIDGTYSSMTQWDTVLGKWFVNKNCDSIAFYIKNINPKTITMQIKMQLSNDTLILQNPGDEGVINTFYKKSIKK